MKCTAMTAHIRIISGLFWIISYLPFPKATRKAFEIMAFHLDGLLWEEEGLFRLLNEHVEAYREMYSK